MRIRLVIVFPRRYSIVVTKDNSKHLSYHRQHCTESTDILSTSGSGAVPSRQSANHPTQSTPMP
jgi:hypothetical protein